MTERPPEAVALAGHGPASSDTTTVARWRVLVVERARHGDQAAFEALVQSHLGSAFRIALAILGNDADARDACQEAFIHAWRELPRLRDPDRFEAWFGRILVNACRSTLRSRGRRAVREIPVDGVTSGSLRSRGAPLDERLGERDALERAFERLSAGERTLLALHYLEHRPLAEIGARLEIPVGTVKSRLHAARRAFEHALEVTER